MRKQIVGVEAAAIEARTPVLIKGAAERIGERAGHLRGRLAPDDVVVESEARAGDTAQNGLAHGLAIIQLVRIRGLEREAAKVDELHHPSVAGLDGRIVDMSGVGQARPRRLFLLGIRRRGRAGGENSHAQAEYELQRQNAKLRTLGQRLTRVIHRSKKRGSRRQPR